jgi:hypothetical protein
MSTAIAEKIWAILHETAETQKETSLAIKELFASRKETDRKFQETERMFQETDRKFQETDRKFQETDRKFQETNYDFKEHYREIDRILKESSEIRKQTDLALKRAGDKIDRLGGRLGDFVEDAVRPAAVRLFRERGIEVHEVYQNVESQRGDEGIEVDLLVVDDTVAVAIECKSKLSVDDVDEHLDRLSKLKRLLPRYVGSRVMGAVAAMAVPDNVAHYAYRKGLFVIGQSGEHLLIRNGARFVPKAW